MSRLQVNNPLRVSGSLSLLALITAAVWFELTDTNDTLSLTAEGSGIVAVNQTGLGQATIILPEVTTSLPVGSEFIVLSNAAGGATPLATLLQTYDAVTPVTIAQILPSSGAAGVRAILLDNSTADGVWSIVPLNMDAKEYHLVSVTNAGWTGPVAGVYSYPILATEHGLGGSIHVQVAAEGAGPLLNIPHTTLTDFTVSASGDITLLANETPDTRYQGVAIITR